MQSIIRRFPVPVVFVLVLCVVSAVNAFALEPAGRRSFVAVTATNLANLRTNPVGTLIASAFVSEAMPWLWVVFAIIGLFPLAYRLGNLRALLLVCSAQVIGTLASEGLLAWRIEVGAAPVSMRFLDDVGPSYVVASALIATALYGAAPAVRGSRREHWLFDRVPRRWWRVLAAMSLLLIAPRLLEGLDRLGVAAVGHALAMATGALLGRSRSSGSMT